MERDTEAELTPELLEDLKLYGDRTSSFLTAYPGFKSYKPRIEDVELRGQIRFVETRKTWVAGNEPLASQEAKAKLFTEFDREARARGKSAIMMPVTEALSYALVKQGYRRTQVGAEAIFDLDEYFARGADPLEDVPLARALSKRGAKLIEVGSEELNASLKSELQELTESWRKTRRSVPLHFLNQVDPLRFHEQKKIFILKHRGRVEAFLAAVPVFPKSGFFYADYIRRPDARAGSIELLFIESMRALHRQGYGEVSLGLCPFARLEPKKNAPINERLIQLAMRLTYAHVNFPYSYKSIHLFKEKLKPTRWEALYLVSNTGVGLRDLLAVCRVHFPNGLVRTWTQGILNPNLKLRAMPTSLSEAVSRGKISLTLGGLFVLLHALRYNVPTVQTFFETNGFSASNFTVLGWTAGPLFHNTHYHLFGDVVTFWIFGVVLEWFLGSGGVLFIAALGLWASNPLTWGIFSVALKWLSPVEYTRLLAEVDYGSSNAVYAFVGALAALLARPSPLLLPFALNGLFLCLARQSWLSLHHIVALCSGLIACQLWLRLKK